MVELPRVSPGLYMAKVYSTTTTFLFYFYLPRVHLTVSAAMIWHQFATLEGKAAD
jgi:hypothetical protein